MVVTLIAIKAHSYGGKFRKVGDVYTAPRSDARVLKALQKARDYSQAYRTSSITAEEFSTPGTPPPLVIAAEPAETPLAVVEPTIEAETAAEAEEPTSDEHSQPEPSRPRRRYRRRDLTAEGDDQT